MNSGMTKVNKVLADASPVYVYNFRGQLQHTFETYDEAVAYLATLDEVEQSRLYIDVQGPTVGE